jgi:outer membrane murein-binding lipoprotein Lpp
MFRRACLIIVLGLLATGCQSSGPLLSRQTTVGTLKTSVSQLEYQNDQLRKQVAELKSESRDFEDRLVQEQAENDDLATRLDNARSLLGQRDGPENVRTGSRSSSASENSVDEIPPPRARRSSGKRKPPAVSIPRQIEPARESDDVGLSEDPPSRSRLAAARRPREERWLPVARGLGTRQGELK